MEINQARRTVGSPECFKIREAHQVGDDETIILGRALHLLGKVQRRPSHPPFPESGGKGDEVDPVAGMVHPAIGKVTMGAAVEWFKKKELH